MNREQLDQRNTATIRRHWRTLTDNGGQPPQQLLDDLAETAGRHAIDETREAAKLALGTSIMPPSGMIPVTAERAAAPGKAAPRRTTTRRGAK